MIDRTQGKYILSMLLENKTTVSNIEREIYIHYKKDYIDVVYQVVGILMTYSAKDTLEFIVNKKLQWATQNVI